METRDENRCAICGWPLAASVDQGCVRGSCSQRPFPDRFYDAERAVREYGGKLTLPPNQPTPARAEASEGGAHLQGFDAVQAWVQGCATPPPFADLQRLHRAFTEAIRDARAAVEVAEIAATYRAEKAEAERDALTAHVATLREEAARYENAQCITCGRHFVDDEATDGGSHE